MHEHRHEAVCQDHLDTAKMIAPEAHEVCECNEKDTADVVPMQTKKSHWSLPLIRDVLRERIANY
jgi:hypothetical protein